MQASLSEQAVRIGIPRANASTEYRQLQNDLAENMSPGIPAQRPMVAAEKEWFQPGGKIRLEPGRDGAHQRYACATFTLPNCSGWERVKSDGQP
jgi:hypothetical protein